jgi:hypothetical protein
MNWNRLLLPGLIALVATAGCSGSKAPRAVIEVVAWNTAASLSDTNALKLQQEILTSDVFLQRVSQKLELAKLWGTSEDAAVTRLRDVIDVELGREPGTFVITAEGLERDLAVKVVNELCDQYVHRTQANLTGKGLSRMQVTIKSRAQ